MKLASPREDIRDKTTRKLAWIWIVLWTLPTVLGWAWGWFPDSGSAPPSNQLLQAWDAANANRPLDFLLIPLEAALGAFYGLVLAGPILGVGQWLALRLFSHRMGWWIPATVAGAAVGWMLSGGLGAPICLLVREVTHQQTYTTVDWRTNVAFVLSGALITLIVGLSIGLCQWLALLLYGIRHSSRWILLSGACWALAGVVFCTVYRFSGGSLYFQGAISPPAEALPASGIATSALIYGWLLGGICLGLSTALLFKHLTKYSAQEASGASTVSYLNNETRNT